MINVFNIKMILNHLDENYFTISSIIHVSICRPRRLLAGADPPALELPSTIGLDSRKKIGAELRIEIRLCSSRSTRNTSALSTAR